MIGVRYKRDTLDNLIQYYTGQVYKMLGLYESKDINGFKHAIKIKSELENLPYQFPILQDYHQHIILLNKLDVVINRLIAFDGNHQEIKNQVMESCNLLKDIGVKISE